MAPRSGRLSKPDAQGQFVRQLGWKLNAGGSRVQHKFRLGTDRREAERRDHALRRLWEEHCKGRIAADIVWDELTLEIARQIAHGEDRIVMAPESDTEIASAYANRLQELQNRFAFLRFVPANTELYTKGIGDKAVDLRDIVLVGNPANDYWNQKSFVERYYAPPLKPQTKAEEGVCRDDLLPAMLSVPYQPLNKRMLDDGATLHQAFDAYQSWIKKHYAIDTEGTLSDHGYTKLGQVDSLKGHHADVNLSDIDFDYIESMYRYWRQRSVKRSANSDGERISHSSIRHYIGELHRFFKWVHRSKDFAWRKPEDLDEIDRTIPPDTGTVKRRIRKVDTFQLQELRLLNRYATPIERLYLMLGLNCGFGTKEIATLTVGEIFLHQALPADEQEVFGFNSTKADSFLSLVRNKTTIVGKFLLFKQTVQLLEWALARRGNSTADEPAILNGNGLPLDQRSKGGNPSRQIPNAFARLQDRIAADGNQITRLPFKYLRKTAGDLIRRFSEGEVSGVFLLHGSPVETDDLSDIYTNRPFGKVYEAIRRVEEYLQPVFEEAGDNPTLDQPRAQTSRKTIDRIAELKQSGKSIREIAEETGKSRMTISRHIQLLQDRGLIE